MQLPEGKLAIFAAGANLRALRERLGLTMRDVETGSARIAERHTNDEFAISPSRLSDIETKGSVPSIFRLYSLAVIYRCDVRQVLSWYGIDLGLSAADLNLNLPPRSHFTETQQGAFAVRIPTRLDPAFDPRRSSNLSRMVEQWGLVPLAHLANFSSEKYTYGYIGSEDFTMYPLLPPGTFLQVDERRTQLSRRERSLFSITVPPSPTTSTGMCIGRASAPRCGSELYGSYAPMFSGIIPGSGGSIALFSAGRPLFFCS